MARSAHEHPRRRLLANASANASSRRTRCSSPNAFAANYKVLSVTGSDVTVELTFPKLRVIEKGKMVIGVRDHSLVISRDAGGGMFSGHWTRMWREAPQRTAYAARWRDSSPSDRTMRGGGIAYVCGAAGVVRGVGGRAALNTSDRPYVALNAGLVPCIAHPFGAHCARTRGPLKTARGDRRRAPCGPVQKCVGPPLGG